VLFQYGLLTRHRLLVNYRMHPAGTELLVAELAGVFHGVLQLRGGTLARRGRPRGQRRTAPTATLPAASLHPRH
jgi:hypothetical protein